MPTPRDVLPFPLRDSFTVEQALAATGQRELTDVLIVGIDGNNNVFITSSNMTRAQALWFAELAKRNALGDPNTP